MILTANYSEQIRIGNGEFEMSRVELGKYIIILPNNNGMYVIADCEIM